MIFQVTNLFVHRDATVTNPPGRVGSHIRLESNFRGHQHRITIPDHDHLRVGKLNAILSDLADDLEVRVRNWRKSCLEESSVAMKEFQTMKLVGVMNEMKRSLSVGLVLAVSFPSVWAQPADGPPSHEDIVALFTLMHVREQVDVALEAIAKQQRTIVHDNLKRQSPRISPRDLARLDQFTAEILKDMPVEDMLEDMIPVYQRHLSKSDVDAMSAFYSSPVGQKLLREMPAMTVESMQAASPRIQAFMDMVMQRAEAMANERNGQGNKNATKEGRDN